METLRCADMKLGEIPCSEKVTHIDDKGFIYCTYCGQRRKGSGRRCRKLKPSELKTLLSGKPLARY